MTRRASAASAASAKEARGRGETHGGESSAVAPVHRSRGIDRAKAANRATIGAMREPFDQDEPERDTPDGERAEPLSPDDPLAPLPFNPYKGNRGLTRAWHALKHSIVGIRVAIREESAFRQELTLAAILVPCGIVVPVAPVERAALLASVLLVLIVELLNSSVEAAIDRISLERHELSKRAKDFGSAAVLLALAVCVLTWALIVGPVVSPFVWHWLTRIS
ncbi:MULTISPECIES: diacylglycerol kinase [unclassified Caballeronia]|uniref:diacylglycerol kinase n=1 Tax=unclassified Caballeronia TaxID=2646786 RepID=UPI002866ACE2|nr:MULTISPECIES: diacylglycerol kinase [unclassified Caballeronia]MDR5751013.1 diacylglycerol kinase [Caballeronia sp. LZ024]MDR5844852.1 diacylglycerol kinase [Caballeronia sp. LZ031]